jgi:hypothetical protein
VTVYRCAPDTSPLSRACCPGSPLPSTDDDALVTEVSDQLQATAKSLPPAPLPSAPLPSANTIAASSE